MDHQRFDRVTRSLATGGETRRRVLQGLAGGTLGILAARFGAAPEAEAGGKGKGKGRRGKGKGQRKRKQCASDSLAPLCTGCQEARCDPATGTLVCQSTCGEAEECCNGYCSPACFNYCDRDPAQACVCKKPRGPEGVYCAVSDLCGENPCEPGEEYDSRTCTCTKSCPPHRPIHCPPSPISPVDGHCCETTHAGYPFAACSWRDPFSSETKYGCSYHF